MAAVSTFLRFAAEWSAGIDVVPLCGRPGAAEISLVARNWLGLGMSEQLFVPAVGPSGEFSSAVPAAGSFLADAEAERLLLSAACDGAATFAAASLKESSSADAELELLALLEAISTFPMG